jgi:hypothetical protein
MNNWLKKTENRDKAENKKVKLALFKTQLEVDMKELYDLKYKGKISQKTFDSAWKYLKSLKEYEEDYNGMSIELQKELAYIQFRETDEKKEDGDDNTGAKDDKKEDASGDTGAKTDNRGDVADTKEDSSGDKGKKEELPLDQLWELYSNAVRGWTNVPETEDPKEEVFHLPSQKKKSKVDENALPLHHDVLEHVLGCRMEVLSPISKVVKADTVKDSYKDKKEKEKELEIEGMLPGKYIIVDAKNLDSHITPVNFPDILREYPLDNKMQSSFPGVSQQD